ncbi:MAG TPA: translocation/assembly module TamB domain-containing protein, partial [Chitinophagaceae bacterium]|nr:translocation/assembly module TamB domain-containing protein [Chitinophagaceae bacterium]
MEAEKAKVNYPKKIAGIILKVVLFIVLFVVLVFVLLLTPPVQRFATAKVENFLESKLKTNVEIGSISIGLPRKVVLENIYIEDQTKDTLVYGGSIKANIALLKLMSSNVEVKDLQLTDITAKIKRVLPDTAFNFQFIIDAFAPAKQTTEDTTADATLNLDIDRVGLANCRIIYKDVVTGNDMQLGVGSLVTTLDSIDAFKQHYAINTLDVKDLTAVINQTKPMMVSEPASKDMADAAAPITMKLDFNKINLDNINLVYGNDVSAFYTKFNIDNLLVEGKEIDLQNNVIHLENLKLDNTISAIRLGKKEAAKVIVKEVKQEVEAQATVNWTFKVDNFEVNDNSFAFDNDNMPAQSSGMDFAHLKADSLTLHVKDFVFNTDSIAGLISEGYFKEKSGFQLDALHANFLYGSTQSYLKDLYIKTPGTQIQREAILEYESYDALAKNFGKTLMNINLANSYVQVKDILAFAPQLRGQPAFRNVSDVWHLNFVGSGNMDRLYVKTLQFDGLSNTQIDASGVLASMTDPNQAGGTFTIRRFHTNQTDIALFTGQRLSNAQMNLPEIFDINGTVAGNAANLTTNLNVSTSAGFIGLNGRFSNLTKPTAATYNANVRTSGLQLGSILRNPQLGVLSATMNVSGSGFTPDVMNAKFKGAVQAVTFNKYTYRNINLNGSLHKSVFAVNADLRDPNIDLTAAVNGTLSDKPTFHIDADIDSVKALPLHFTTEPLTFKGKIFGDVTSLDPDFLEANILLSNALLVSGTNRLTLDSLEVVAGRTDTSSQFIRLRSDIANAFMEGTFRYAELGDIIINNIQPYFSITDGGPLPVVHPYDFRFNVDVGNSPFLSSFVPGFNLLEPLHMDGSLATDRGLQGSIQSKHLVFANNDIQGLDVTIGTTPNGLQVIGNIGQVKSGTAYNIYNTQLRATALNNNIDFSLNVDDKNKRDKYTLSGLLTQPVAGTYALSLRPDSLLLNYEPWTVSAGNQLVISPTAITANNFTLSKGAQRLSLQSLAGTGSQPLNVTFNDFQLSTITGFLQSDSLLVNGAMNGTVTFTDLMKQPLFTSDLNINDLSLRQDTIGNISLKVASTAENRYITNITLTGNGNDLAITGWAQPQGADVALNLDLAIRKIELASVEGALKDFVKTASGSINGNVAIRGTTAKPSVVGDINFNKATLTTVAVGGPLTIDNEKISVTENGFVFDKFSIRDSANNALTLNGNVQTTNFINYGFNLDVDASNFRALNTTNKDNKIYYGDMVISTNLHIGGTELAPIVDGSVTINDGTNFTIVVPQAEPGVVQREGIVEFVDFNAPENDSLFLAYDSLNVSTLIGYDITTNIEIKKEANFNIVVDEANGDFLNLKGSAILSAGIDPSGKINLTGTYEIDQGAYQLSFNFLQRKFQIQKGSKITWMGEPTNAQLDLTAVYLANTAPLDLVERQIDVAQRNYYLQKLPFQVLLQLDGELMKPVITFDIVLPTDRNYNVSNDVVSNVTTRLAQLRQEPAELNKQVFAILLLNRFVGENPFESSAGGGFNAGSFARQSVSKLLTE